MVKAWYRIRSSGRAAVLLILLLFIVSACYGQQDSFPDSAMKTVEAGRYPYVDGIIIAQKGKTLYQHYFNGYTADSLHDMRSAFKSITGLLMGIAIDKGYIKSVQQRVYPFFTAYGHFTDSSSGRLAMRIQNLLEMKSGFDCEEWNGTRDCEEAMSKTRDWLKFSLKLPMANRPGTVWAYSSVNAMIVGGIIAAATKMPLGKFAERFLFRPLGIRDYRWTRDPAGHYMTAGSFFMKPADMLKVGQLILSGGRWKGHRILSKKWVRTATAPITKIKDFSNVAISGSKNARPQSTYYGYYWYQERLVTGRFNYNLLFASGNGGQYIMVIPELNLVVVFTGHSYNSSKSKLPFAILIENILPCISGRSR